MCDNVYDSIELGKLLTFNGKKCNINNGGLLYKIILKKTKGVKNGIY